MSEGGCAAGLRAGSRAVMLALPKIHLSILVERTICLADMNRYHSGRATKCCLFIAITYLQEHPVSCGTGISDSLAWCEAADMGERIGWREDRASRSLTGVASGETRES